MNATGTAARRSVKHRFITNAMPREFVNIYPEKSRSKGQTRGRSLVRGLPVQLTYAFIDTLTVFFVGAAMVWLRFGVALPWNASDAVLGISATQAYEGFFLLYAMFVVMGCASLNLYRTPRDRSVFDESVMVAKAIGIASMILVVFIFISGFRELSRQVVLSSAVLNVVALSGWRYCKRRIVLRRAAAGVGVSRVLIVGSGNMATALGNWLESNPHLGYHVCGYLDGGSSAGSLGGNIDELKKIALTQFVDEIFITIPAERSLVKRLAFEAHQLRVGLKIFPDLYDGLGWSAPLHMIGGFPVMDLHWQPIPKIGLLVKRCLDIVISGVTLVVAAPILGILALWVHWDSPGSAIYAADRIGLKGRKFRCYKLRTMVVDADSRKDKLRSANQRRGPFFKIENDPRITRIGRWLRKSSLDELPQLWNVFRGEMSLVGPRPHPVDDYKSYSIEHLRRLDVTPGLTGLWQVSARCDPSFETNMALDLEYIENWSLGLDLKIMLRTIPALFRAEGR